MEEQEAFIRRELRGSLLRRLLEGRAREVPQLPALLRRFDLEFPGERFCVLIVWLGSGGLRPEQHEKPPEPDLYALATDALLALEPAGWRAYPLLTADLLVCLLCACGEDPIDPAEAGRRTLERCRGVVPVGVALSGEKQGLGGINDAYFEAMEVVGCFTMQDGGDRLLSYDALDAQSYEAMETTFDRDRRLINCVLEGDRAGTLRALERAGDGRTDSRNALMMEKRHMLGVVNQMTAEITGSGDRDYLSALEAFPQIMDAPAPEQLDRRFRQIVLSLCGYFSDKQADISAVRAAAILEYIDRNYQNPDLDINELCGVFKISPSYIARIFKKEIGESALGCIQKKRIEAAKRLLSGSDLLIRQIAERVGFLSAQTFIRTFKSRTGTTPAAYRTVRSQKPKL